MHKNLARRTAELVACAALLAGITPAHAAVITLSSPDLAGFSPTLVATGGTVTPTAASSGGNPGAYLTVTQQVNAGTPPSPTQVSATWNSGQTYSPASQGAITNLDFLLDVRMFFGFGEGQAASLALFQGGSVYVSSNVLANTTDWTTRQLLGLTAASFTRLSGAGPTAPNFTSGTIGFGMYTANTSIGNAYTIVSGYDNWRVVIRTQDVAPPTSVPEPGTLGLLALAIGGAAVSIRRRVRAG